MRTEQDSCGGLVPVTDKLIGNAFDVVKYVSCFIKEIRYVAYNMEHIFNVSQDLRSNIRLKTSINALGGVFEIPLPDGVSGGAVLASNVIVTTPDNEVYGPSENTFTWVITGGNLRVTVSSEAPVAFVGSEIRWMLTWTAPSVGV